MASRPAGSRDRLQLESRLKWLMFGRLAIAVVGVFAILLVRWPEPGSYAPYYTLLAGCLLNLVYLILARAGVGLRSLAVAQLSLDVLIVGLLAYLTGIDGFFAFLYFGTVIAAAMILGSRVAIGMASAASIVLAVVWILFYLQPAWGGLQLPLVDRRIVSEYEARQKFILPFLFFFAVSLHVVALLAGRLTAEVSRVRILNEEILQNMAGGVLAADRFGGVQFINAPAAKLLGLREGEDLRGRQIDDTLPRDISDFLRQAMRGGERISQEFVLHGSPVRVAVTGVGDGESGPLRGVVAIFNDLSLRTQMEVMTRRAERFKALLEMSAGMAHEIRNPLASIRGAAQELQTSNLPREDDRQLLGVVIRESDRLDEIISEFLDYANDRPIELGLCDLADVLNETVLLLEARGNRNVEIRKELPRTMVCRGAPDKLKQVFLNLGINALDACAQNVKIGHVLFRCVPARGAEPERREGVLVEVADDGCGVSRENLGRVFDPFFSTKPRGVGMGLAIARKIVQAHEGEITMESTEGKGTRVKVWLPV
ncbi:MAG: PAS domain-containing protein [Planctomycetes bacterium]|nr:PAS domain-containing protein [Planctomycetota bacterium]